MNDMKQKEQWKKWLYITACILLFGYLGYNLVRTVFLCVTDAGIHETRMSTKIIQDFVNGINPYGTDWLYEEGSLPATYYESGFFHILPSVVIARLFNVSVYSAAAVTHIIYILSALSVMILCVNKMTGSPLLSALAADMYNFCLNTSLTTNVRPETLCSFCIVLIIYLLTFDSEKKDSVQTGTMVREWIIAFLCVLLVFLKIHYASIIAALFFVFLYRKRLWNIIYKTATIGILTTVICVIFFPTFFSTFGVRVIEMLRDNTEVKTIADMWRKWLSLFLLYPLPFILVVLRGVLPESFAKAPGFVKRYFTDKKDKLLGSEMSIFFTANVIINFIALCFMGKWPGNTITYHCVMIMPTLIIASVLIIKYYSSKNDKLGFYIYSGFTLLTVAMLVSNNHIKKIDFSKYQTKLEARENERAELDKYKSDNMLLSPKKAFYALENDIYQWDFGDQIYLPYNIGTSPRWNFLFPYTNLYRDRNIEYANKMLEMIENKEYSIIITDDYNILGMKLGLEDAFKEAIDYNYKIIKEEGSLIYLIPDEQK